MLTKTNLILAVMFLTAFFFSIKYCGQNRKLQSELILNEKVRDSVLMNAKQSFNYTINQLKDTIVIQKALNTKNQAVINKISKDLFALKAKDEKGVDTKILYREYTTTKIDTINLVYRDTVALDTVNYANVISVPRTATVDSPDYKIKQIISATGVQITELSIPDTLNLRVVEHKKGFIFKNTDYEIQSFHSNKIIKTTGANSMIYTPEKKSFLNKLILPVIAFVAGVYITLK